MQIPSWPRRALVLSAMLAPMAASRAGEDAGGESLPVIDETEARKKMEGLLRELGDLALYLHPAKSGSVVLEHFCSKLPQPTLVKHAIKEEHFQRSMAALHAYNNSLRAGRDQTITKLRGSCGNH